MKGFVHVVEVLLIAVLVFLVFSQFSSIPSISDDWPRTKLNLIGGDVLGALEKKGINWFNKTEVENELNRTLPGNIIYSVLLENVIKPEIKIGCLCDGNELSVIDDILYPGWFNLNDENVTFELIQVSDKDELFSLDFDVAIAYGYEDFSTSPYALRNFLNYDKGVVEIFDPTVIDNAQRNIFGLDSGSQTAGSGNIGFSTTSMENGKEVNKIYDYFTHLETFYDSFENLNQWYTAGNAEITSTRGKPAPSIRLMGNSESNFIRTRYYRSFERGDIDFDLYLETGASLFIEFRKVGGYQYLASLSSNHSIGYDSFYRKSPLQSIQLNSSHLTNHSRWNHIKIVVKGVELKLYNNGENVAEAVVSAGPPTNITMFNLGGDAYVDNLRITYGEEHEFENFLESWENTTQYNNDENKILLRQIGGLPACVINYNVEAIGRGRTAWLSNNSNYDSEDFKILVKSLIVWAAGDEYRVIKSEMKRPISTHIYKILNRDMFQNVKISLELGYLY